MMSDLFQSFFYAFNDDIKCIKKKKKNFYSIVQLSKIHFSLRPIMIGGKSKPKIFLRLSKLLHLKNLSIFDNLSILLLNFLERGGERRRRLSSGRIRVKGDRMGMS